MIDLDALIQESQTFEPLPASATRLAAILARDEWDLADVVAVISLDSALTARLLRIANSVAFAGAEPVTSVERASQRIGAERILTIAVGAGARKTLSQSTAAYGLAEGVLWRHSVASALASEMLNLVCAAEVPSETFATSLLHDVGKVVLCRVVTPEMLKLLTCAQEKAGSDIARAEMELLEIHHGELGGLVAQHWGLPDIIVAGIIGHHNPGGVADPREQLICDVVCVADAAANSCGYGLGESELVAEVCRESCERLGLTDSGFEELCEMLNERVEEVLGWYD